MRRFFTGLALVYLVATFLCVALAWAQDEPQGPQPSCVIDELRHDMGEVFEQDKFVHVFKVKNVGDANLEIISVKPG